MNLCINYSLKKIIDYSIVVNVPLSMIVLRNLKKLPIVIFRICRTAYHSIKKEERLK
jgi:hypothetical protein